MARILFVMTGADHWTLDDGTQHPTGFWAEEFVAPYQIFVDAGHEVEVATPDGVVPTVDRASLAADANGGQDNADALERAVEQNTALHAPSRLEEVDPSAYSAVFYPGGHGPMEDLADNADSARVLTYAVDSGTPLGVLCHAPAALLAPRRDDGSHVFLGYRLTSFTNEEEKQVGLADKAAWLLQDRLEGIGADFTAGAPWQPHVVHDRTLFTGQNPASSTALAAEVSRALT
ncbi:type 1 glutamine amidotransferase domain-containing protein [Nocardiopsis kunsanensis]|uniref:type 1 glutamine amidotransferase domain-containing protein n=1 Tax=Nocardiopsis kunsanensis TaxID=141693 RepID=UPI000348BB0F|nr:type 1 glutamine amidotransferase domain-containing protein [Nocardiopsis kunsanensis]